MKVKVIFFIKCIIVMMPIILVSLYAQNNMMGFVDEEAPYYIWNRDICTTRNGKNYDVVVLGDSVANAAYIPEVLSDSVINLSLGGATPMENYFTMKEFLKNRTPKSVYISFMDFHLRTSDCFWKRTMYSHRYSINDNWRMLLKAKEFDEESIYTQESLLDFISYELFLPSKYITSLSNAGFNQRYNSNMESYELNRIHGGRYIARGNNEWKTTDINYDSFELKPLFEYYYEELIKLCISKNIEVHIIKLPMPNTVTFSDQYNSQFNSYYQDLQNCYPGITVDRWCSYDSWYFSDECHMNTHGAFKFSCELKDKYKDEFNEELSKEQLLALDDDILNEKYLSEVFNWVSKYPVYSLFIYDGIGDFEQQFEKVYSSKYDLCLKKCGPENEPVKVYLVGKSDTCNKSIYLDEDGRTLEICQNQDVKYDWKSYNLHGVNIVIVNNETNKIICEKEFKDSESL